MQPSAPDKRFPFNLDLILRRGLGRTLLLCLFGLAVVPSLLVGVIGYRAAFRHIEKQAYTAIGLTAGWKRSQLQALFDTRASDAARRGQAAPTLPATHDVIQQMLSPPPELPDSARIYLVDADLRPVAGTIGSPPAKGGTTVDTALTRSWQKHLGKDRSASSPSPFSYSGPRGRPVMGTYARLHLGKTPYALVVEVDRDTVFEAMHRLRAILLTIVCLTAAAVLLASLALARAIVEPLRELSQIMARVASGGNAENIDLAAGKEIGELAAAAGGLMGRFRRLKTENAAQSRMITGLSRLQGSIAGEMDLGELCLTTLEFLADFLDLHQADFFVENHDGRLERISRFPGHPDEDDSRSYPPEKAPIRRAAMEKGIGLFHRRSPDAPASSVSAIAAANLMIVPLVLRQIVKGALELEKREHFSSFDLRFVQAAARLVGAAVNTALIRRGEKERLAQARKQVEQLKRREAALEASTSDLRAQRRAFQASEEALQLKQLELEAANAQMAQSTAALEAHMAILKKQQEDMRRQNAELEETHRQLEQKARQLEISSRYKSEFMANMSHELRTPLNSILLLSRLLLENKENTLTDRQAEFARTIHMAGEDLLNLINDILDLAKVEAGKMELVSAPMHIRSMAEAMRVNFAPLAEQRGLVFGIDVAPGVPDQLIIDRKRVEQIIKNFLSNAFKFTAKGAIRLEIALSREAEICRRIGDGRVDRCLAFSVTDTGIGIPAAQREMVFEAFQQVDGSIRRKYGGTGLGLSISRELARLLGGEITLESRSGQGSRFTLHLPLVRQADGPTIMVPKHSVDDGALTTAPLPAPTEKAGAPSATDAASDDRRPLTPDDNQRSVLKGRKVLLVDDDMRTVFAVSSILEDQGAEVLAGKTGKESLDKMDGFPDIDLVLMDVMIANVDGYQAIREIRRRGHYHDLPIIVLTAKAMQGDRDRCIAAGADDYLAKPVNLDKLTSMLTIWLDPQRTAGEGMGTSQE